MLAACGHKAEWICPLCAKCPLCCECIEEADPVHINTKEAAIALASYAKRARKRIASGPGDPNAPAAFNGGDPTRY